MWRTWRKVTLERLAFRGVALEPCRHVPGSDWSRPAVVAMEEAVPLYHFDLVNSTTISDQGGAELTDDIEAMDSADAVARRILDERPDLKDRHYHVLVTNEDGEEVFRLPLEIIH
jgi:hypothetical protein